MNPRTALNAIILLGLALLATGCCTGMLVDYSKKSTRDTFLPRTLYQETNHTRLAIEGTLFKHVPQEKAYTGKGLPQCLMLPDNNPLSLPAEGKEWQWLHDNRESLCKLAKGSTLQDTIPPNYERVAVFKDTYGSIPMPHTERKHTAAMACAPLTVAADVVTLPLQLIGWGIWLLLGHPM